MGAPKLDCNNESLDEFLKVCISDAIDSLVTVPSDASLEYVTSYEFPIVYASWMSMILVTCRDFELKYSVHFNLHEVEWLARKALNMKPEIEMTRHDSFDFMREICNTVAGNLKNRLYSLKIDGGFSLPLLTRGFDHIIINKIHPDTYQKNLIIRNDKTTFINNYNINCKDWSSLNSVDFMAVDDNADLAGVIDLL